MYGRIVWHIILSLEPFRPDYWFWQFYRRHERLASGSDANGNDLWLDYLKSNPETDDMHLVGLNKNDIYESTIELYRWDESEKHSYNTYAELEIGKAWNDKWSYQVSVMGPAGSGELGPLVGTLQTARGRALKAERNET